MIKELIKDWMKPVIEEVYREGYKDGERRVLKAYEYGWAVGHADTMAELGAIQLEESLKHEAAESEVTA